MKTLARCLSCLLLLLLAPSLQANDHGGGGGAAESYRFVVNLARSGRILQTDMVFEGAHAETAESLKVIRPKVQHALILILSAETPESLQTLEGKEALAQRIRKALNALLKEDEKSGVKEVLFTNFIMQ
ncbi:flagellar basal body-associated protein FliL [Azospira sp. I13]|uniref:flagellar basal body-associated FliL family protein n=1 Tax=Azospira sp. I13 TaxID=1765050 RepID=UPI000D594728|nr:flagellar basal body-associated FliL family protein [Azospira sp. I13]